MQFKIGVTCVHGGKKATIIDGPILIADPEFATAQDKPAAWTNVPVNHWKLKYEDGTDDEDEEFVSEIILAHENPN